MKAIHERNMKKPSKLNSNQGNEYEIDASRQRRKKAKDSLRREEVWESERWEVEKVEPESMNYDLSDLNTFNL